MVCHTKDNVTYSELIIIIHWDVRTEKHGRVLFLLLFRALLLGPDLRVGGRLDAILGLIPEAPWIVEAAHLGEEKGFHFLEFVGVAGVLGEIPLL